MTYHVVAFYKFISIPHPENTQSVFKNFVLEKDICGTVLVAPEGLNGTVAGSETSIADFVTLLKTDYGFGSDDYKFSMAQQKPFPKAKVKLKKEIVTLKRDDIDPTQQVGTYIDPKDWNDLISQKDVIVIDTRNNFEVQMGTFENALDPDTSCFSQFPDFVENNLQSHKDKKIAMFCTGGIRCEKASSYMLKQGFKEVYHLKGGILKYLETISPEQSKWMGGCFVFDERVAVGHGLQEVK